jgi:DNA-binding NarL/FixJ family response regulator
MLQARDDQQRLICHEHCRVAKKLLSGAPVTSFDLELASKSADSRWINLSVFRYADEHKVKPYIIHLFRDITQQKMEVKLVERLVEVAKNYHNIQPDLLSSHKKTRHVEELTPRESEVLGLLARGNSTREIGQELSISVNTTRNHIQNILRKLDVHTRLEAVIYAIDHNLVDQID